MGTKFLTGLIMLLKGKTLFLLLALAALFVAGCGTNDILFKKDYGRQDGFARGFFETLRKGDHKGIEALSTPELTAPQSREKLEEIIGHLRRGEIVSTEVIGTREFKSYFSKKKQTLLAYQMAFSGSWLKAVVLVDEEAGVQKVSTLYVEPLDRPLSEIHAFALSSAPASNFVMLLVAAAVPAFIIYAMSVCIRSGARYRVLWICFMLVGLGTLSYDWSSGQMGFRLFSVLIFGSGAYKDTIYGPWVINTSFPLGALAFLIYRNNMAKEAAKKG